MTFLSKLFGKKEPKNRLTEVTVVLFFETELDATGFCREIPDLVDTGRIHREADGRGITLAPTDAGRFGVGFRGRFTGDETRHLVAAAKRWDSGEGSQWTVADREVTDYVFPGARS